MMVPKGFPTTPPQFEYETVVLESIDGEHSIFMHLWKRKEGATNKALMIVHGQGEHGGRYQHFCHYLQSQYDIFFAVDLRGHGRSEGIRGHVEQFGEYVDDALLCYQFIRKRLGEHGVIDWFAHSMGGTVTLRMLQMNSRVEVRNFILSSPGIDLSMPVPKIKKWAAGLLQKLWGSLQMPTAIDPFLLTHDEAVVRAIRKDSLHHTYATPDFFFEFLNAMERIREEPISFPAKSRLLLQLAGEDRIVSTEASETWFANLSHPHKDLREYPGLHHEIYNETVKEKCFQDWIQWIQ